MMSGSSVVTSQDFADVPLVLLSGAPDAAAGGERDVYGYALDILDRNGHSGSWPVVFGKRVGRWVLRLDYASGAGTPSAQTGIG